MSLNNNKLFNFSGIKINSNISAKDCQRILDLMSSTKNEVRVNINSNDAIMPKNLDDIPSSQYRLYCLSQQKKSNKKLSQVVSSRLRPLKFTTDSEHKHSSDKEFSSLNTIRSHIEWEKRVFQVVYGRYKPYKKNKEWTYDGFIVIIKNGVIALHDCAGKM